MTTQSLPVPLTPARGSEIISPVDDNAFWMALRQALLLQLDVIERRLGVSPTTAELRKLAKQHGGVNAV